MVDYSKWDHFGGDSDDEPDVGVAPRVTRLDEPSTVQTAKDGSICILPQADKNPTTKTNEADVAGSTTSNKKIPDTPSSLEDIPIQWTQQGSRHETDQGLVYFWSQDRETATLRMILIEDTNNGAKYNVTLTNALSYRDRHVSALASPGSQKLIVTHNASEGTTILERVLAHPAHLAEHDEVVDWCIQAEGGFERVLCVTLHKATPMTNMHVWWKRFFTGDVERDEAEDTPERRMKQQQFEETWREAHEQFRANVRAQKMNTEELEDRGI